MIAGLLDKVGALQRMTRVIDSIGGNKPAWANVSGLGSVGCAIGPVSYMKAKEFSRRDMVVSNCIYTAIDVHAATTDRWLINGDYYVVCGYEPFVNPIFGPSVYVTYAEKRNQS